MIMKEVYGVKMTEIEDMKFSKYRANNNIAMNTLTKDERKALTEKFLNEYRINASSLHSKRNY